MDNVIDSFKGKYFFLSNFYIAPVVYDGLLYTNNEAAFQSAKCLNKKDRLRFTKIGPRQAKQIGRKVNLRPDWEDVKLSIMHDILLDKFLRNPDLKKRLLATGNTELIGRNTWGDRYWGVYNNQGHNHLGKQLMLVRDKLRDISSLTKEDAQQLYEAYLSKEKEVRETRQYLKQIERDLYKLRDELTAIYNNDPALMKSIDLK